MNEINSRRLLKEDYTKSCKDLAVYLLGKTLIRQLENGELLKGKIVETECYLGGEDKASHSYNGKVTKRNEPMYMPSGTTYVYVLYFGYHCLNISSEEPGACVLIRSLEVVSGREVMEQLRVAKIKNISKTIKTTDLCNGPSKLCIAMDITRESLNKFDLTNPYNSQMWIEEQESDEEMAVINTSRIGLGPSAEEWKAAPLRYYILNNKNVSKRDKKAEKELMFLY
ncbi:hypothetical protein NQ318_020563 [Aromia moschata]|uniref:DNA-3-methyladenine glycosylase n=1 Tax=Aromia moschata TaxID=1265417 RepID=A0AAV8YZU4_9CUCU|nr:hypothetical protein NQ318_020563 [Aromia moschata]